jgi:hypothetical protein
LGFSLNNCFVNVYVKKTGQWFLKSARGFASLPELILYYFNNSLIDDSIINTPLTLACGNQCLWFSLQCARRLIIFSTVFSGQRQPLDVKAVAGLPPLLSYPPPAQRISASAVKPAPASNAAEDGKEEPNPYAQICAMVLAGVAPATVTTLLRQRALDPAILGIAKKYQ